MKKKNFKKILHYFINFIEIILGISLVLLLILIIFQNISKDDSLFGYRIYTVASNSMRPTYEIGDTLLIKEVELSDIKVGDVISYKGQSNGVEGYIITHKVINIEVDSDNYYFHTKGEANEGEDPLVSGNQVVGKVIHKFLILSILGRITSNIVLLTLFITIPLTILIVIEIIKVILRK